MAGGGNKRCSLKTRLPSQHRNRGIAAGAAKVAPDGSADTYRWRRISDTESFGPFTSLSLDSLDPDFRSSTAHSRPPAFDAFAMLPPFSDSIDQFPRCEGRTSHWCLWKLGENCASMDLPLCLRGVNLSRRRDRLQLFSILYFRALHCAPVRIPAAIKLAVIR